MAGITTELSLSTAVDTDDTADYLTLNLASSLRTIDALFNNVTGHTHASAHQGGPIAATSLRGAMDLPDWFRSTGRTTPFSGAGIGIELYWGGTAGVLQGFNRATAAYAEVDIFGNPVKIGANGGTALTVNADNTITVASTLTAVTLAATTLGVSGNGVISGSLTVSGGTSLQGLAVAGSETVSGSISATGSITSTGSFLSAGNGVLYMGATNDTYFQRTSAGQVSASGSLTIASALGVNGLTTLTGAVTMQGAASVATNLLVNGVVQAYGGQLSFSASSGSGVVRGDIGSAGGSAASVFISQSLRVFWDIEGIGHDAHFDNGACYARAFNIVSDPNLKAGLTALSPAECLADVLNPAVTPYTYTLAPPDVTPPDGYVPQYTPATPQDYGFSAEEMRQVCPEVVSVDSGGQGVMIAYSSLVPVLWGAVRQLDARLKALEAA